jgi:mRNA interferase HigB
VRVIGYKTIEQFARQRPDARAALERWYKVVRSADWASFVEIRNTFRTADWVKPYLIFDIAGNKYRLIAEIEFQERTVLIRHILTHNEYDKGGWKT